jgi:hypothetical protein
VHDLILIAFNVVATLFIALAVAYLADEAVGIVAENRIVVLATGRVTHPLLRAAVVVIQTTGIVLFTWLTFGVATEPQHISALNGVINWLALAFEAVVIVRALTRGYRAMRAAR